MKKYISQKIKKAIKQLYGIEAEVMVESPKEKAFGDYSTGAAMKIAKQLGKNPQDIAKEIIDKIKSEKDESEEFSEISQVNGFINFKLSQKFLENKLSEILEKKSEFGDSKIGKNQKVQLEFISANPTGPLVMVSGRLGFLGDALAKVLKKTGYKAQTEYYVNDIGNQIEILGESVARRILEAKGQQAEFPDYCYPGEYIKDIAKQFIEEVRADYSSLGEITEAAKKFALVKIIDSIRRDLKLAGIEYDRWFFESELYTKSWTQKKSEADKALGYLKENSLLKEEEGAVWFKSSQFGDEKDRVVIKEGGEKTYFASDIAYFNNKINRGFKKIIEIFGADHHGYVPRIKAIVKALGNGDNIKLDFILVQMARLIEKGEVKKMSKRAGTIIELRELLNEVGPDAARFFFLMYDPNTHMDFDLDLAKEKSQKNPVYYVQYAYARLSNILKKAEEADIKIGQSAEVQNNNTVFYEESELNLIKEMLKFPDIIEEVSQSYEASRLPHYAIELAKRFHDFYEKCRVISDNKDLTAARLRFILGVRIVLRETLRLMGVSAPEKM